MLKFISPNGNEKWVRAICKPDLANKGPKGYLLRGTIQDITEQKKAEKALQESEKKYSVLADNMNIGLVLHAADTKILFSNSRASEILGLSVEQMQGKEAMDPAWKFLNENESDMALEDYPVNRFIIQGLAFPE